MRTMHEVVASLLGSRVLPCIGYRRELRRGPLAGKGALTGGGGGGAAGRGAAVGALGRFVRGGRGRGWGFGLVSSSHRRARFLEKSTLYDAGPLFLPMQRSILTMNSKKPLQASEQPPHCKLSSCSG